MCWRMRKRRIECLQTIMTWTKGRWKWVDRTDHQNQFPYHVPSAVQPVFTMSYQAILYCTSSWARDPGFDGRPHHVGTESRVKSIDIEPQTCRIWWLVNTQNSWTKDLNPKNHPKQIRRTSTFAHLQSYL